MMRFNFAIVLVAMVTIPVTQTELPTGFPRIKHQKDYYDGDVGQVLKMLCEVEGVPAPSITWFKDNAPIDVLGPRRAISKSGSLTFNRLMKEDDGIYECLVINPIGSTLSVKMQLKIRNTPITPHWVFRPSDVEVRPGHGVNLTCMAKGNPSPQLRWLTQYYRPINDLSEKESILLLTDITEPATYICRANNSMGVIQHHVKVRVKMPSPPLNIRLNQLRQKLERGKTVLLADMAWDPPENNHGTIVGYRVKHKLVGPQVLLDSLLQRSIPVQTYVCNVSSTNYTSTFEEPLGFGKTYEFSVSAINNIDIGLETKINVSTRESAPDMYPVSIEFTGLTSQSVNISWQQPNPEHHNGILISYQVMYFLYGLKNTTSRIVNTAKQYVRIEDLKENVLYTFQVRAYTNPGPGPWCPKVNFRTVVILPDPPTTIVAKRINDRQIKVTWDIPPNDNVKVIGFKIYYCSKEAAVNINNCNTLDVGPVTMATLGNLESDSDYLIGIKSRAIDNRFGVVSEMVSVKSSNIMKLTEQSVRGLKCDAKVTSIEINWNKPEMEKELLKFLVRIHGFSTFLTEKGKFHKITRTFKVREVEYGNQFTKFVINLMDMEPNTVYDISVETMSKKTDNTIYYGPIQNTSCRTLMARPQLVTPPEIISVNVTSLSVLFRVHRVTERLGVIRRYYLIVDESSNVQNSLLSKYSLDSLKSVQKSPDSPTLVAEFSTEVFKGSANITFGIGNDLWLSQSSKALYVTDYILMSPMNLQINKRYQVYLRACIYVEFPVFPMSRRQENQLPCTDSTWSSVFDFQNSFIPQPSSRPDTIHKKKIDVFTVAIIAVIVDLGVVALISIAVGCFMKCRRSKRYYNSPQELIMKGDPSLKHGLIPQASPAPPAYVP